MERNSQFASNTCALLWKLTWRSFYTYVFKKSVFLCQDVIMNKYTYNKYKYIKNRYMLAIIDTIIKMMSKERCGYGVK